MTTPARNVELSALNSFMPTPYFDLKSFNTTVSVCELVASMIDINMIPSVQQNNANIGKENV